MARTNEASLLTLLEEKRTVLKTDLEVRRKNLASARTEYHKKEGLYNAINRVIAALGGRSTPYFEDDD